jgi:hypothetical protein
MLWHHLDLYVKFQRNKPSRSSGLKRVYWEVDCLYRVRGRTRLGGLVSQSRGISRRWCGPTATPQQGNRGRAGSGGMTQGKSQTGPRDLEEMTFSQGSLRSFFDL